MSTLKNVVRRVLNLPETADSTTRADLIKHGTDPVTDGVAGAATVPGETRETRETVGPRNHEPWEQLHEESRGRATLRRAGRTLVFVVLGLLLLLGVRALFTGSGDTQPAAAPGATFPVEQAQAVAGRFAVSYLTVAHGEQDRRAAALALDSAAGLELGRSWNGRGTQAVRTVLPGEVKIDQDDETTAVVTVLADLDTSPGTSTSTGTGTDSSAGTGDAAAADSGTTRDTAAETGTTTETGNGTASSGPDAASQWVALGVPVAVVDHRVVVTGDPAFVGLPEAAASSARALTVDNTLSDQTREGAEAFFRALASHDRAALEQVSAPGASIAPLGSALHLVEVTSWQVEAGDDRTRTAHAEVTWQLGQSAAGSTDGGSSEQSGLQLRQSYQLTLSAITASGQRPPSPSWRVQAIQADTSQP